MSLDCWDDYNDGGTFEAAYDAGFWSPDDVDELRAIVALVDTSSPAPGDRAMAALVLLKVKLNPTADGVMPEDPHVTWAKRLLEITL